jgi:hypothetical protein
MIQEILENTVGIGIEEMTVIEIDIVDIEEDLDQMIEIEIEEVEDILEVDREVTQGIKH